jgi:hypothetical protein
MASPQVDRLQRLYVGSDDSGTSIFRDFRAKMNGSGDEAPTLLADEADRKASTGWANPGTLRSSQF